MPSNFTQKEVLAKQVAAGKIADDCGRHVSVACIGRRICVACAPACMQAVKLNGTY